MLVESGSEVKIGGIWLALFCQGKAPVCESGIQDILNLCVSAVTIVVFYFGATFIVTRFPVLKCIFYLLFFQFVSLAYLVFMIWDRRAFFIFGLDLKAYFTRIAWTEANWCGWHVMSCFGYFWLTPQWNPFVICSEKYSYIKEKSWHQVLRAPIQWGLDILRASHSDRLCNKGVSIRLCNWCPSQLKLSPHLHATVAVRSKVITVFIYNTELCGLLKYLHSCF